MRAAIAIAIGVIAITGRASAHGTFPEPERIALREGSGDIVVQTSFGLVASRDDGASWGWICSAVLDALDTEDPRVLIGADGAIVLGVFAGLRRGERLGCAWGAPSAELDGVVLIDLDRDPRAPEAIVAVTSSGGRANAVHRSLDGGATWSPTGPAIGEVLFESVRVAPGDPDRLYVSGAIVEGTSRTVLVHRSLDGGATWTEIPFAPIRDGRNLQLLAVDPEDADRIYARVVVSDPMMTFPPTRIVRSDDGGETWIDLATPGTLTGLLVRPGGVVLATFRDGVGLARSSDRGASFEIVHGELDARCLGERGAEIWVCANEYRDGFAVARSSDEGVTLEPVLQLADVTATISCDEGDATREVCVPMEPALRAILAPPPAAGGCACACEISRRGGGALGVLGLVLFAIVRRRRRA